MSGGGSPHLHSKFVHGCYRCEISREEADVAIGEELDELNAKLAAIDALHQPWTGGIGGRVECVECGGTGTFDWPCETRAILDGPTP